MDTLKLLALPFRVNDRVRLELIPPNVHCDDASICRDLTIDRPGSFAIAYASKQDAQGGVRLSVPLALVGCAGADRLARGFRRNDRSGNWIPILIPAEFESFKRE